MEMTIKKNYETRRRILAVVLFFGMSAATVQVFAAPNDAADGVDESLAEENKISSSGVQISGMSGTVTQSEDISSRGNAVEFSGAFVRSFNLSSKLTGGKYAIYIDGNSLVRNININDGAKIFGDIVSAWQTENYSPDRVTNLNINTDFIFDRNISGAESIKLHVSDATMKFSGAADILSVDVGYGAQLFGGTFNLNNMSHKLAEGVMDTTTGKFINHGTIGAGSPETNLVINGNLISDGVLQKVSGGKAGMIIVNGNANVNGSTVTTDSMLPNETATVLIAKSVTGKIKNSADNPYPLSAFLSATGEIVGNSVVVKTYATTNEEIFTPQESETFTAMREMFERLDDNKRNEMRPLYNMTPSEAKRTLTQIGSNDAAQIMSVAQQNIAVDRMISHRVSKVFAPEHVNVNVHPMKFADGEDDSPEVTVKVKVPKRQENNFWINYMKNWGQLGGNTDYHGSVIVGGYDRPIGRKWRAGIFATYGTIGYGAKASRATVYDTRLGLYAGYHNRQSDVYLYLNGGQLRNSLHRGISSLGLSTNANYKSRIIELGGEYKYDLTPKKLWHVSPFVNFQVSHLKQNAYNENGAGIYNQHVAADSNTYFAAQTGLDLKRYYKKGMVGLRFGVKHGFTGADPDLHISYEGDGTSTYRLRQERDKTHFVFSVRGESEFANGWFMGGEAELQRGENDRDVTASVMLRRIW
ncbi:MAG: autotransporter domain-containing protein [Selenomonadaceae bacterium]|nr:autotransporter domain-containing protein [Selenomonadaceae bacterium]